MIFGQYPCCNRELAIAMPEKSGCYSLETCPHCGAKVWHFLSRFNPMSWTEEDFLKSHRVDPVTKTVEPLVGAEEI